MSVCHVSGVVAGVRGGARVSVKAPLYYQCNKIGIGAVAQKKT